MDETIENDLEDLADEQQTIREKRIAQLRPYQFKKGQTGNALGRYLGGKSGKERTKAMIASMTDDEFEEFMEGMNKLDIWQMGEGRPDTKTDITTKGEKIEFTPAVAKVVDEFESKLKEQL